MHRDRAGTLLGQVAGDKPAQILAAARDERDHTAERREYRDHDVGGGDDVREQQSFEASSPVADDRRASDVKRPESIDRPQPIDKAEPLPERDDTSRKGLLRRIFKG